MLFNNITLSFINRVQGRRRDISEKAIAIVLMRDDGDLNQNDRGRGSDIWLDIQCISKVKPIILSEGLDMRTYIFVLGNWKDRDKLLHRENSRSMERRSETQFRAFFYMIFFFIGLLLLKILFVRFIHVKKCSCSSFIVIDL